MVIKGKKSSLEFFTGYIVEQSLSIDNLFIFIMLFDYFKVPEEFQSRVLTWGIIGAMSMRAVMIVLGVAAIQRFRWVMLFFAGVLVVSSLNLLIGGEEDHADSSHLENNIVLKIANWLFDSVDYYDGEKFFTLVDGVKKATPLLLCLICIELTDFVFAVDSIPAVLGISHDTFIVYASNVFAICAMRSIYTLVSHAISDMPYLKPAVALVLGFVGAKMCAEFFHYKVDVGISLLVVTGILAVGAIASVVSNRKRDSAMAASVSGGGSEGLTFKSIALDEDRTAVAGSASGTQATNLELEEQQQQQLPTDYAPESLFPQSQSSTAAAAVDLEAGEAGQAERALLSTVEEGVAPREDFAGELAARTEGVEHVVETVAVGRPSEAAVSGAAAAPSLDSDVEDAATPVVPAGPSVAGDRGGKANAGENVEVRGENKTGYGAERGGNEAAPEHQEPGI